MDAREILLREQARIARRLEELDRYPADDPYKDGTVLMFSRQFAAETRAYDYVAIRANGRWYTSAAGSPAGGRSWGQFVQWLVGAETSPLQVMVPKGKKRRALPASAGPAAAAALLHDMMRIWYVLPTTEEPGFVRLLTAVMDACAGNRAMRAVLIQAVDQFHKDIPASRRSTDPDDH